MRAPFQYFGGKGAVAPVVWRAFGPDVANYIEPFCGSCAVLLQRPGGAGKIETVNDLDGFLTNVWRSIQLQPEETARWCDWPVHELDMHAREAWLVTQRGWLTRRLRADPDFCYPKVAAWWIWGASMWIGGGWCAGRWQRDATRPNMKPQGVHKLGMMNAGNLRRGLHREHAPPAHEWFQRLSKRLRRVRVCCGDFERVLGNSVIGTTTVRNHGMVPCAVFLDPPYDPQRRAKDCYASDRDPGVARRAARWALEHGDDADLRIAVCGYESEHDFPDTWTAYRWKGRRGYAGADNRNRDTETIWFSPHCLPLKRSGLRQLKLDI
jgi:DNA adenine methylase